MPLFLQVSATDEDRGSFGAVSYALGSPSGNTPPNQFTIDKESGQLCTSTPLDRDEGADKFDLTITATDGVRTPSINAAKFNDAMQTRVSLATAASFQDKCQAVKSL